MGARLSVVADELEGVLLAQRVAVALEVLVPDGQARDLVAAVVGHVPAAGEVPLARQVVSLLREHLVLARGRGERAFRRGDGRLMVVGLLDEACGAELLEGVGQVVAGRLPLVVAPLDPVELGLALGELVLDAERIGQKGADLVDGLGLEQRLDGLRLAADEAGPGGAAGGEVVLLEGRGAGQDDVGGHGRRRHPRINRDDHAHAGIFLVWKIVDAQRVVDVGVLAHHDVGAVVPDELDGGLQLQGAGLLGVAGDTGLVDGADAPGGVVHDRVVLDGLVPVEERHAHVHRVLLGEARDGRGGSERNAAHALTGAGAAAGNTHVAGDGGDHRDGAGVVAAVGVTLRAPALNGGRRTVHVQVGQLADSVGRDSGNAGGPLGGLLAGALVGAGAGEVGLVGHVLLDGELAGLVEPHEGGARGLGGFHVVGEAVGEEADELVADELLVQLASAEQVLDHAGHERHISAGADRDPAVGHAHGGVRQVRIHHYDGGLGVLQAHLGEQVLHGRARHAGVGRVVTEQHDVLGVHEIGHLVVRPGVAVEERHLPGDLTGGVVGVLAQVAAPQVHETREHGLVGVPRLRHRTAQHAGAVLDVEGVVAVLLLDLLHGGGDEIDGLVPGDLLVLALAALSALDALERLLNAVGAVDALAVGAAAHAGAHLVDLARAELVIAVGIDVDAHDLAVLHIGLQRAAATAVHVARRPANGVVVKRIPAGNGQAVCGRLLLLGGRRAAGQRHADPRRPGQAEERPAADLAEGLRSLSHRLPFPLLVRGPKWKSGPPSERKSTRASMEPPWVFGSFFLRDFLSNYCIPGQSHKNRYSNSPVA